MAVNDHVGFSIVAPITSTVPGLALETPLQETATNGVVSMYQLRYLDYLCNTGVLFPFYIIEAAVD